MHKNIDKKTKQRPTELTHVSKITEIIPFLTVLFGPFVQAGAFD